MEMSDHEISLSKMHIRGKRRHEQTGQTTEREQSNEAKRIQHRRVEPDGAPCIVPIQLNTLMADGTATIKLRIEKTRAKYSDVPATNM